MRPTRITADVVQVPLRGASAFLLLGERVTIIDSGLPGSAPALLAALWRLGRSVEEVEQVLLTHYHLDHLGGLAALLRQVPARVGIHALEAAAVSGDAPLPPPLALPRPFHRLAAALSRPRRVPVDTLLRDGDELHVLGGLHVLHTPGHTPGHVAFLLPERGVLIAGDALARRRCPPLLPAALRGGRNNGVAAARVVVGRRGRAERVAPGRAAKGSQAPEGGWFSGGALTTPSRLFTADWPSALRSVRRLATLEFETLALSHFPPVRRDAAVALRRLARSLPEAG